jgi:hypothetical protein
MFQIHPESGDSKNMDWSSSPTLTLLWGSLWRRAMERPPVLLSQVAFSI